MTTVSSFIIRISISFSNSQFQFKILIKTPSVMLGMRGYKTQIRLKKKKIRDYKTLIIYNTFGYKRQSSIIIPFLKKIRSKKN